MPQETPEHKRQKQAREAQAKNQRVAQVTPEQKRQLSAREAQAKIQRMATLDLTVEEKEERKMQHSRAKL